MIITIDGPCASGKSSVARLFAQKFNYYYVYTGLLYRAFAYLLHTYLHLNDEAIEQISTDIINDIVHHYFIEYQYTPTTGPLVFINKINITDHLKSPLIDHLASIVGTNHAIRVYLTEFQRKICTHKKDIILDGRDSGSVVFPNAEVKIYLTALLEVRIARWLKSQGSNTKYTYEMAYALIQGRDHRDSERVDSPLVIPKDAHIINNSSMNIEETIEQITQIIKKAGSNHPARNS